VHHPSHCLRDLPCELYQLAFLHFVLGTSSFELSPNHHDASLCTAYALLASLLHKSGFDFICFPCHLLLPTGSGNDFVEQTWSYHDSPLQHSSLSMEDRVPHQQGHTADMPGAAQHESYAAAQGRQALPTTDTDLGCAGAFEGAHAEDLPARGAVSAQLDNPAGASDFAQGLHNVPTICRLPLTEAVCLYPCLTSI